MVRRYDPERRQRIIDAAIRVVGAKGIAGLSHRSVAAEADVPLGSTTYHFKTLDDLLVAALRQTNEGFARLVAERESLRDRRTDLAAELAALLGEWLAGDRTGVELEYELYLAALRRPALRPVAAEWTEEVGEHLADRTDPATARALLALMDGICLQVLLTGVAYEEGWAREVLGRVIRTADGTVAATGGGAGSVPAGGAGSRSAGGAGSLPGGGGGGLSAGGAGSRSAGGAGSRSAGGGGALSAGGAAPRSAGGAGPLLSGSPGSLPSGSAGPLPAGSTGLLPAGDPSPLLADSRPLPADSRPLLADSGPLPGVGPLAPPAT